MRDADAEMGRHWNDIGTHYAEGQESQRLAEPANLERLRTLDILSRYLPKAPACIYDVGGAAGVYAFPLAAQGYELHLIEPVRLHLEQAKARNETTEMKLASIHAGHALALQKPDESADAVLLFGPLYHLVEREQRLAALKEGLRVLKPGARIFVAAISRFASLIDLFPEKGVLDDERALRMVERDVHDGQHRCPPGMNLFTTAFFHHPDGLRNEMRDAGFADVKLLAVEGPVWKSKELSAVMAEEPSLRLRMELLRRVEEEPSLMGASAHIMAIGKK